MLFHEVVVRQVVIIFHELRDLLSPARAIALRPDPGTSAPPGSPAAAAPRECRECSRGNCWRRRRGWSWRTSVPRPWSASPAVSGVPRSSMACVRPSSCTARNVHTAHCPSRPPRMRSVRPPKWNGVSRSTMMLSSLPVYSAISSGAAGFGDGAHHVERLVAIERRDLDRHHIFDLRESAPEFVGQHAPAHRRLQIESEHRHDLRDGARVLQQLRNRRHRAARPG